NRALWFAWLINWFQPRKMRELQRHLYGGADIRWAEMEHLSRLDQALVEPRNSFPQFALDGKFPGDGASFLLGSVRFELLALAQHRLLDLSGNDRPHLSQVVSDRLDLASRDHQKLQVSFEAPGLRTPIELLASIACADWMPYQDLLRLLTVAIDTSIPL